MYSSQIESGTSQHKYCTNLQLLDYSLLGTVIALIINGYEWDRKYHRTHAHKRTLAHTYKHTHARAHERLKESNCTSLGRNGESAHTSSCLVSTSFSLLAMRNSSLRCAKACKDSAKGGIWCQNSNGRRCQCYPEHTFCSRWILRSSLLFRDWCIFIWKHS